MRQKYWRPYSTSAAIVRLFIPDLVFRLSLGDGIYIEASIRKHLGLFRGSTLLREVAIARCISACAPPNAVIYDVGANIGLYTMVFARTPSNKVMSFEPSETALPFLRRNISLNKLDNVEIHPVVLSDHAGECTFALDKITTATSHVAQIGEPGAIMQCTDLDSYVARLSLPPPDVVKLDVEGHDREIIKGMRGLMAQYHPTVFLEGGIRESDGKISVVKDLAEVGYEIWNLDRTLRLPPDMPDYSFLAIHG